MITAECPCGWTRTYAFKQGAYRGVARHQARGAEHQTARVIVADDSWGAVVTAAGLPVEHTAAEWRAHPYALDDLLRVLGGTRVSTISHERDLLRHLDRGAA